MSSSRSAFILARSLSDVERACQQVTAYLSIRRHRSPAAAAISVQGILIDEHAVAMPPAALDVADASDTRRLVRVVETLGLDGVWMLCCLDAPVTTSALGAALSSGRGAGAPRPHGAGARFIPLPTDAAFGNAEPARQGRLAESSTTLVPVPVHRRSDRGRVIPLVRPDAR